MDKITEAEIKREELCKKKLRYAYYSDRLRKIKLILRLSFAYSVASFVYYIAAAYVGVYAVADATNPLDGMAVGFVLISVALIQIVFAALSRAGIVFFSFLTLLSYGAITAFSVCYSLGVTFAVSAYGIVMYVICISKLFQRRKISKVEGYPHFLFRADTNDGEYEPSAYIPPEERKGEMDETDPSDSVELESLAEKPPFDGCEDITQTIEKINNRKKKG